MAERFKVLRHHVGDREYNEGDERLAAPADVKHLVDLGVLRLVKAEAAPKNKAEPAPANKAVR